MPSKTRTSRPAATDPRTGAAREADGVVYVTRQVHFNAAHRLHNPSYSKKWNEKTFGPCTNPHWHGHNYVLEATVAGVPDKDTGYVINLVELKRILNETVVDPCDHRNLNEEVDFLKGINPSTENLVIAFWKQIEPHVGAGRLHSIKLYETPRNFVEYLGPNPNGVAGTRRPT